MNFNARRDIPPLHAVTVPLVVLTPKFLLEKKRIRLERHVGRHVSWGLRVNESFVVRRKKVSDTGLFAYYDRLHKGARIVPHYNKK